MKIQDKSNTEFYLESLPLNKIARYSEGYQKTALPFTGYPKQHSTDKGKLILICDPLEDDPEVLEFKLDDIYFVEEVSQVVTEKGEGIPILKFWVRRGARATFLERFEVGEHTLYMEVRREIKAKLAKKKSEEDGKGKQKFYQDAATLQSRRRPQGKPQSP